MVGLHRKRETPGERGLPKTAESAIEVVPEGVVGDFNRYRTEKLNGDPDSALLLMPTDNLATLRSEGWPIRPGDLGENVAIAGIRYAEFVPTTTWQIGEVVAQVSRACDPCTFLYLLPYVGEENGPRFLQTTLGRRGWYARVIRSGRVRLGDPVVRVASSAATGLATR